MNYTTAMIQLPLVKETGNVPVRTPEEVSGICDDLRSLAQEVFQVLCLNKGNYLVNRHMVTLGLADASLVHPREVFRTAISDGASVMILVQDHPSGDPTPSAADIRITDRLIQTGKIVDISVMDHIIIGRTEDGENGRSHFSMREEGICQFG